MSREVLDREPDDRVRILDADGEVVSPELVPDLDETALVSMYRDMRFSRRLDERLVSLQRQGRLGTYAPLAGQEGSQIGSTYALADEDWIFYQYREHGAVVARGITPEYLLYWMGHEIGNAALAEINVFPLNISIGSQLPHAVGWAWGSSLDPATASSAPDTVTAVHFGDGATSEGDVHEAMNVAGGFDVPVLFICNNNQWAISHPRDRQTASQTIAQKAHAYGFRGVQVDGMDPLATYVVTTAAREKARSPTGDECRPTLIETVQYRYGAHTTADDPTKYRDEAELERWRERDPIDRFETYLIEQDMLDADRIEAIDTAIEDELDTLISRADSYDPDPQAMFEYTYAEPTDRIAAQREWLASLREQYGDDALLEDE